MFLILKYKKLFFKKKFICDITYQNNLKIYKKLNLKK